MVRGFGLTICNSSGGNDRYQGSDSVTYRALPFDIGDLV